MAGDAIERCAYCRRHVPVTFLEIAHSAESSLTARVPVCEDCRLSRD